MHTIDLLVEMSYKIRYYNFTSNLANQNCNSGTCTKPMKIKAVDDKLDATTGRLNKNQHWWFHKTELLGQSPSDL